MQNNKLHIVALNIPYPPDYGGVIDIFYKINALSEAGTEIYLHCFEYGRKHSKELDKLCKKVWYYPRKTGLKGLSFQLPYITYSRRSKELLQRLIDVEAPILFEGVHTTYYLSHPSLHRRFKAVRTHNIEHEYYTQLYNKEKDFSKKQFFKREAKQLEAYEKQLADAQAFVSLSAADTQYFKGLYPSAKHLFAGPFHPFNDVDIEPGKGKYCLYHGDLSHPENAEAALFLLNEVFPHIDMELIIAGKEPAKEIFTASKQLPHCRLIANPSFHEMEQLIRHAQVHTLPTFQATGTKLKLLYALFTGRHVLVNEPMLHGTTLGNACHIATNARSFIEHIERLSSHPFTQADVENRRTILAKDYSNAVNAQKIITCLQR